MEDWCAEGIFLIFLGKGNNYFKRTFHTIMSFVKKNYTTICEQVDFLGVLTAKFHLKTSVLIYLNYVLLRQKKTKNPL